MALGGSPELLIISRDQLPKRDQTIWPPLQAQLQLQLQCELSVLIGQWWVTPCPHIRNSSAVIAMHNMSRVYVLY